MVMQLIPLGLLAVVSLLLFFPLNTTDKKGRVKKSWIIKHIPFLPVFIIPYLGLFPYLAFSMLTVLFFTPVAGRLYVSLIFSGLVAAFVWYFMPSIDPERPNVIPKGPLTHTISWMYRVDPGKRNALPSSHTYTALICSYYLAYAFPLHEYSIWMIGATIVSSTLFIKQHHVSDLIAGMALAAASIAFSYFILGALP